MASERKTASPAKAASADPQPVKLAPAAEATDPAVHQVLAELATARSNGDEVGAEAAVARLADLGYE